MSNPKQQQPKMEDKNFGLTQVSFQQMVTDLKKNDTKFFEQVFLKQFKETMSYIKREYSADPEDAYDATMDALLELRRRFVMGKLEYGNLRFLFTKMSSQIYLKNKKKEFKGTDNFDGLMNVQDDAPLEQVPESFSLAWQKMGAACKKLLTLHFYGNMRLTEIAEETLQSAATVRKQKERCIIKLKDLMTGMGKDKNTPLQADIKFKIR